MLYNPAYSFFSVILLLYCGFLLHHFCLERLWWNTFFSNTITDIGCDMCNVLEKMIIFVFRARVLWISFVNMNNFLLFCVLLLTLRMYINFEWLVYLHGTRINCLLQFIYYLGPFSFLRMLLCFVHLYIVYFFMSFPLCFYDSIVMSGKLLQMCMGSCRT